MPKAKVFPNLPLDKNKNENKNKATSIYGILLSKMNHPNLYRQTNPYKQPYPYIQDLMKGQPIAPWYISLKNSIGKEWDVSKPDLHHQRVKRLFLLRI